MEKKYKAATEFLVNNVKKSNPALETQVCKTIYEYVKLITGREQEAVKVTSMLVDMPFITL